MNNIIYILYVIVMLQLIFFEYYFFTLKDNIFNYLRFSDIIY